MKSIFPSVSPGFPDLLHIRYSHLLALRTTRPFLWRDRFDDLRTIFVTAVAFLICDEEVFAFGAATSFIRASINCFASSGHQCPRYCTGAPYHQFCGRKSPCV